MDTGSKLTINKESMALRDAPVSTRRCRTFHPETAASAVLSSAHGTFSRVDHTLGHNPSLNKLQEMDIIPRIFSQHDATERQMNPKSNPGETTNPWKFNYMLPNQHWVNPESKEDVQNYMEAKGHAKGPQPCRYSARESKKTGSSTTRKIPNTIS